MKFEWSEEKSKRNYIMHGVRFEEAQTVFHDLNALDFFDVLHSVDEDRFIRLGLSCRGRIVVIVYCERETQILRLISARIATTEEREKYEKRV